MTGFKHLVIVKFKADSVVDDILKGMEKLVSEIDIVKSLEWYALFFLFLFKILSQGNMDFPCGVMEVFSCRGEDIESEEMLRQGFTHAFLMSFDNKEDYSAFVGHASHVEFSATFSGAIDKIVLLDFPCVVAKGSA
ncbi:stress-response A/B barrel domain-containing protein At5g22580-like [Hibiscus syriacus]|uniref:stress-response A/B barrel domain-containing protein At5g22580-like n=1 Tax=Hibiscus syriacus TaxID=106335 RepID=UPI0019217F8E|nr:stress-response A/B barrel domain-containing protein At5g22580-like [Hibiscus syriacus]